MLRLLNNTKEIKNLGGILLKVVNVILVKEKIIVMYYITVG